VVIDKHISEEIIMPSLLNTVVTANYQRMTPQDTYGTGSEFGQFGTRPMRLLKIVGSSGANRSLILQDGQTADGSLTAAQGMIPGVVGYKQPYSLFSRLVRTLQTFGEVYVVGQPDADSFMAMVSADTINDADSSNSNTASTTYTLLEAALAAEVARTVKATDGTAGGCSATITVTAYGTAANKNFFVGAALGTFA